MWLASESQLALCKARAQFEVGSLDDQVVLFVVDTALTFVPSRQPVDTETALHVVPLVRGTLWTRPVIAGSKELVHNIVSNPSTASGLVSASIELANASKERYGQFFGLDIDVIPVL